MALKQVTATAATPTTLGALLGVPTLMSWVESWQIALSNPASAARVGVAHLTTPATPSDPTTYSHQYKWGERNDSQQFGKANLYDIKVVADITVAFGVEYTPATY